MSDAIERAAAAMWAIGSDNPPPWEKADESLQALCRNDARVALDAALEPHWLAGELALHSKKLGHRGWPVPCTCGHPEWSYQHQAEAVRAALLGEHDE